jgi:hypothetical protein
MQNDEKNLDEFECGANGERRRIIEEVEAECWPF